MKAIVLDPTTYSLQCVLGEAIDTDEVQITGSFHDLDLSTTPRGFDTDPINTVSNGTTDVTIVSAPAASHRREVVELSFYNADVIAHALILKVQVSATEYIIFNETIAAGETITLSNFDSPASSGAGGAAFDDAEGDPADVAAAEADGTSDNAARRDHVHKVPAALITLAMMADLAEARLIGRAAGAGTGVPTALTPAQLLAILLTVDGAASGLDADLLDGASGAAYLARANHTGTQTAATISDFDAAALAALLAADGAGSGLDADLLDGISSGLFVQEADYNAQTILAAVSDNTPVAVTVGESELVGRPTGGNVGVVTAAQLLAILLTVDGASSGLDADLLDGISSGLFVQEADYDANTILAANSDNTPLALTIAEQRLVGRITGGNIDDLTPAQVRTLLDQKVIDIFYPTGYEPPAASYATLDTRNAHVVLDFDGAADEEAVWKSHLPTWYGGGGLTVDIYLSFTSATSGTSGWQVAIERIDLSGLDIDADSFVAFNGANVSVPGTSGMLVKATVTFTDGADMDSLAAGEPFRLKIRRDADGTVQTDDVTTDAEVHFVVLKES